MSVSRPLPDVFQPIEPLADITGDTPLHSLIRTCRRAEEVEKWLEEKKAEDQPGLAKAINANSLLPIDLIGPLQLNPSKNQKLYALLAPLTQKHEPAKISEIPSLGEGVADSKMACKGNLTLAYKIIAYVRGIIDASSTHPETNTYSNKMRKSVIGKIEKLRENYFDLQDKIIEKSPDEIKASEKILLISKVEWLCKIYRVGNCLEFAYLGLSCLLRMNPGVRGEIFRIGQGDHWFIVLDRKLGSDEHKPDTWGETAVSCDPFVGFACSAKELFTHLKDYREIHVPGGSSFTCLVSFNPSLQYVERWLSCDVSLASVKKMKRKMSAEKDDLDNMAKQKLKVIPTRS